MQKDAKSDESAEVAGSESTSKLDFQLFGRNLAEIPCLRSSLLGGLLGGLGAGIIHFMATSNTRRSLTIAQFSPVPLALVLWMQCRYENAKRRYEARRVQTALAEYQLYRGTEKEAEMLGQAAAAAANSSD